MYRIISRLMPRKIVEKYRELLVYSDIKVHHEKFVGFILLFGLGVALAVAFDLAAIFGYPLFTTFVVSFAVFEAVVYSWLLLKVDAKTRFVEKVLSDVLQLTASNLRAGITTDKALLLSARPEFGTLSDELNKVGKEVTTGKDIDDALINMTNRIQSEKLKKSVMLIVSGLRSGGELAPLLEQTSKNLRNAVFVEEKIKSNVRMYIIFIFAAIAFGAPMLFGLSSFLAEVMAKVLAAVEIPETTAVSMPITLSKLTISPGFIISYIIVFLITTSTFGSLLLGSITTGEEKRGIRFIPILITLSLAVFFLVRWLITRLFGGLFNI